MRGSTEKLSEVLDRSNFALVIAENLRIVMSSIMR
jgi:hypothetical protein